MLEQPLKSGRSKRKSRATRGKGKATMGVNLSPNVR